MTLLIFDCDGTLVDSELLHAQVDVEFIQEKLGLSYETHAYNRQFIGAGVKEVYKALEQETGRPLPPDFDAELHRRKDKVFSTQMKAVPHVIEVLQMLGTMPRCIASNTSLATLEISLAATKLYDFFTPHIFSAQMVKHGKPSPDLFLYAAQQMNTLPQDCIVIEDSIHGVEAGVAAGMRVFGFCGGGHCYPGYRERLAKADLIFDDMRELPSLIRFSTNETRRKEG